MTERWKFCGIEQANNKSNIFLERLRDLRDQWNTSKPTIPADWIGEHHVESRAPRYQNRWNAPIVQTLRRVRNKVVPLPLDIQELWSLDPFRPEPDFFGTVYAESSHPPPTDQASTDNIGAFHHLWELFYYPGGIFYCESKTGKGIARSVIDCLEAFPGFLMRTQVENDFSSSPTEMLNAERPVDFAMLIRQHGFKEKASYDSSSRQYHDSPLYPQLRKISLTMPISLTHPAVILGILDSQEGQSTPPPGCPYTVHHVEALEMLASQVQPSLEAILKAWDLRWSQRDGSREFPAWLIVFGLLIGPDHVTIVAHYPLFSHLKGSSTADSDSAPRFCSCIMDSFRFHRDVQWISTQLFCKKDWVGPTEDDGWIMDRLRLFLALLVIVKNSYLISAIWDDIDWPRDILDAEDVLEKRHADWTAPTPNPSVDLYDSDGSIIEKEFWFGAAEEELELEEEEDKEVGAERERAELEESRRKVLAWQDGVISP